MAKVAYRVTRSRKKLFDSKTGDKVKAMLMKVLDTEVKPHYLQQFNNIVANWRHKPKFTFRRKVERDEIAMFAFPSGPNKKYWIWTSRGTKPHIIAARRAPTLRFQANYTPKTTPKPTWGGSGRKSGPWRTPKAVRHPGTTPRNFEEFIFKKNKSWFSRTINNAWRRIIRSLG